MPGPLSFRALLVVVALSVGACVGADNAFDPDAPRELQAPAEIFGRVLLPGRDFDADPVTLRVFDLVQGAETEVFAAEDPFRTRSSDQALPDGIDDDAGAAGTFSLAPLSPGSYRVSFEAHANGEGLFEDVSFFVTLAQGERLRRDIVPGRADLGEIGGTVEGSVEGAQPGKLFVVSLLPQGINAGRAELVQTVSMSESGAFAFSEVPPGEYALQAAGDAYVPNGTAAVEVQAGAHASVAPLRLTVLGQLFSVADFAAADGSPPFAPYLPSTTANIAVAPLALVSVAPPTPFVRLALADRFPSDAEEGWQPLGVGADAIAVDLDETLPDGAREILGQLRLCFANQCRCEEASGGECSSFRPPLVSGITSLSVIVDRAPPEPVTIEVDGADEPTVPLVVNCARFGEECPPSASAPAYSPLVEARALDRVGRVRGFAVTLDDADPPNTFSTVDALESVADFTGNAPGLDAVAAEHTLRIYAQDRAGNVGLLAERPIHVDVTPLQLADPAVALAGIRSFEDPAAPGLTLQIATETTFGLSVLTDGEPATTARVRAIRGEAALNGAAVLGFAAAADGLALGISGEHRQSVALVVDAADDAGNVVSTQEIEIVRWTRGSVVGEVEVEGQADAAGARVTLLAADGVTELGSADAGQSTPIGPAGSETFTLHFALDGALTVEHAPAGEYLLRLAGATPLLPLTRPIVVRPAERDILAEPLSLTLPRAGLRGVFALEGREGSTNNAGIQVTLFGPTGTVVATGATLPDGSYQLGDVPAGTGYSVIGFFPSFVQAEVSGITVSANADNLVADDGAGAPSTVLLRALTGDFTLCAPTGDGLLAEACPPLLFTNLETVQVGGTDLTGFTQFRISTVAFSADDASPAFEDITLGAGGAPVAPWVTLGGDGERSYSVYLQLASGDGNASDVLEVDIVFDQTPPSSPLLTALRGEAAFLDGFTNASVVKVSLSASADGGAPLGDACVRFLAAPPVNASGMTCGLHNTVFSIPLDGLSEGLHTAYAFSCDRAGNCSDAPVSAAIVFDQTPPIVPTTAGTISPVSGAGFSADLAPLQFDGARFHVNTRAHNLRVEAGTAAEPDPDGAAVPEIVAVRFSLDAAQLGSASFLPASPFREADGSLTFTTPSFVGAEGGDFALNVQLADAAGNLTSAGALGYALRLDTTPPRVGVSVPSTTSDADGAIAVSVTDLDSEVLVRASFFADEGQSLELSPASPQVSLGGDLLLTPAGNPAFLDGEYAVNVSSVDRAGNSALASRVVLVDRQPPSAPVPSAPLSGAIVTTQNPTYRWDAVTGAAFFLVTVKRDGVVVRGPSAVYTSSLFESVALARGNYTWQVEAVDSVGNESGLSDSFPVSFTVDDAAPTGLSNLALAAGGSATADTTPSLSWTAATDPGSQTTQAALRYTVEIFNGSSFDALALSSTVTGGSGTIQLSPGAALTEGQHSWRVTVRDNGDNALTIVGPTFTVDSQPPLPPVLASVGDPAGAPVLLRWAVPADPDRVGVRLQVAGNAAFSAPIVDSLQTDVSEDITSSLVGGQQYFVRVASEDSLGNREFVSPISFTFDGTAPKLAAKPIVVLDPGGVELAAGDLIVERNVSVRLHAGVSGERVRALVSNEPGCALPSSFELDTDNLPNTIAWTLAPGGATKRVFARFVDDAGNFTPCVGSAAFGSTGVIEGNVLIDAGSTGLSLTGSEALGIGVRLTGGALGAARLTTTNASGYYRFEGVPVSPSAAANTLQFARPELSAASTSAVVVADQTVSAPDVTMTLRGSSVSGSARLHANRLLGGNCAEPTNHSSITLSLTGTAWNGEAVTRSTNAAVSGAYSFTGVPGGVYRLSASRDGYLALQGTESFQVSGGTNVTGRDFDLFDQVAPEPPLISLASAAVTAQANATISVDIEGDDATTPASNFDGYRVLRVSSGSGSPQLTPLGLLSPASSYDLALTANRTNRFVFVSQDCAGNESAPVEVTVVHDGVAPGAPTNVRIDNRDGAVRVTWTPRPASEGVVGYRVLYGGINSANADDYTGEGASQGASPIDAGNVSFLTLTGLTNQAQLYVAVQAVDGVQDPGPNTSALSQRVTASPAAFPLDVAATVTIPSGNDATTARDRIVAVNDTNTYVYTYDTRGELSLRGSLAIGGDRVWGSPDHHTVYITSKTDYAAGLKVVDVSDPTAPRHVQTYNTSTRRRYHLIAPGRWSNPSGTRREHIYAVYEEEGTNAVRIHSFRSFRAGSPALVDNGNSTTVPTAATCLASPSISGSEDISELRSAGDLAFLTIGGCLKVLQLNATGTAFTQTDQSSRGTAHGIRGTHVDMPYLYSMAQDNIFVQLVDRTSGTLSDPRTPGLGDALEFSDASGEFNIGSLASAGVLITAARGNLTVYDTSTISVANVPPASRSAPGAVATGFLGGGGGFQSVKLELLGSQLMLFRREGAGGVIRVIEMGGTRVFEPSADISSPSRGRGGVVRGSTLARFITTQTQLELIDLRDAAAPALLDEPQPFINGGCTGTTQATCMLVERDSSYAYVSNNSGVPVGGSAVYGNNLIIFDVSDPQNGVVRSVTNLGTGVFSGSGVTLSEEANALAVFDDVVAVGIDYPGATTPEGYVHFLDVRDRAAPLIANLAAGFDTNAGDVRAVALDGTFAYVGKGTRLCVVDLFNTSALLAPTEVGCQVLPGSIGAVALRGTELIVAAGAQLLVFDVSDPTASPLPQRLVRATPTTTVDLAANGLGVYVLAFSGSVIGFDLAFETTGRKDLQAQVRGSHIASSWPYAIDQAGFYTLLFNENITTRLLKQQ